MEMLINTLLGVWIGFTLFNVFCFIYTIFSSEQCIDAAIYVLFNSGFIVAGVIGGLIYHGW